MMMLWFDRLFPVLMLLMPGVVTLCVRPHEDGDRERAGHLARGLWFATLLALVLHGVVQVAYELRGVPGPGVHRAWIVLFPMAGFMLLWFGLAGRVLAARHPGWGHANPPERVTRSASLAPRHEQAVGPSGLFAVGWVVYAVCVAVTGWAVFTSANPLPLLGLLFWPGFAWGARATRLESEPLDAAGSPELAAEYAAFRRFRAGGFVLCGMAGSTLFAVTAVLMVLQPQWAGLVGGIGGSGVGVLGGVFGTLASIRRARLNARLVELERDPAGC